MDDREATRFCQQVREVYFASEKIHTSIKRTQWGERKGREKNGTSYE